MFATLRLRSASTSLPLRSNSATLSTLRTAARPLNHARRPVAPAIRGSPQRSADSRPPGGHGEEIAPRFRITPRRAAARRVVLLAAVASLPSAGSSRSRPCSPRYIIATPPGDWNVRLAVLFTVLRRVWLREHPTHETRPTDGPGWTPYRPGRSTGQRVPSPATDRPPLTPTAVQVATTGHASAGHGSP